MHSCGAGISNQMSLQMQLLNHTDVPQLAHMTIPSSISVLNRCPLALLRLWFSRMSVQVSHQKLQVKHRSYTRTFACL